ncbi:MULTISPECIES: glycosyltransferase [Microbacterium]|uniref:D-inositol 3-phosphate glycosyltransferase n=1 Tax=Microbacterium aurugineum TaxID=2851642 RepID=A0ABY4IUK4_9MICO|nr:MULTISPECIES: glycosyltransferase [Microbacterium]MCE0509710.1 glycosyltransferase [Microbacterium sp. KKR3/1]MCK8469024.1 glycosyltransferase [Microbacterium aurugineum]MCK8478051.1 glycosyltransferase [Microbacterium aurugineum]QEA27644.1 glycosyltransferase family 4 protein [Microbacterium sp. CBA3102]TCJ20895.1 glycosyltransferase family 4 protein [Microbacterium sp. PI-1]
MSVTSSDDPTDPSRGPAAESAPRPLKIVIGCDTFAPDINGAARFAERLAAGLVQRGHDVHVVAPNQAYRRAQPHTEVIEGEPMTLHRLPSVRWAPHDWLRFVWPWRSKHYARKVLDQVQPDVVHIQSHIVIGRGLAYIANERGIPVIATNHVMAENILDHTTMPKFIDDLVLKFAWADAKRTFDKTRAITTPTRRAADFLEKTVEVKGVIPVSCGIDRTQYTPVLAPRDENRIIFVGRLTAEKQVEVILKAMTKLDPALDTTFDIVGGGDQRKQLEHLTAQLGLADRVTFHGRTSDEELRALLSRASLFVIASIAELQSIATMEAMASALPVVAADAVALPHLVHDGENGYLFEPGNVDELAARLTDVLTAEPAEYERMQRASLDGVAIHDINRTLDTFEALYRDEPLPE